MVLKIGNKEILTTFIVELRLMFTIVHVNLSFLDLHNILVITAKDLLGGLGLIREDILPFVTGIYEDTQVDFMTQKNFGRYLKRLMASSAVINFLYYLYLKFVPW